MKPLGRRSPSIVNAAYGGDFMWDGRAARSRKQAPEPINNRRGDESPIDTIIDRNNGIPELTAVPGCVSAATELPPEGDC